MTKGATSTIHATAVVIGESGVVILGESGAGKSTLARDLVGEANRLGLFARLVGDDRIGITPCAGRILARPHPLIAGRVEVRGLGLSKALHEPVSVVRLAVVLADDAPERLPPVDEFHEFSGIAVPLIRLQARSSVNVGLVLHRLNNCRMC